MAKDTGAVIGKWAFIVGFAVAVIFGLLESWNVVPQSSTAIAIILMVAGILVGFLNVDVKEKEPFMIAGAVLIIATVLGKGTLSAIAEVDSVMSALLLVFVPTTIIVALRSIFVLSRD